MSYSKIIVGVQMKLTCSISRLLKIFTRPLTSLEKFKVNEIDKIYISRVDTGALVCSLHVENIIIDEENKIVQFDHDNTHYSMPLLRIKSVKNAMGIVNRPRVSLTYQWNGRIFTNVETSLADRSNVRFKLLIGRNLIKRLELPVYISDQEVED